MTVLETEPVNAAQEQLDALNAISNLLTTTRFDLDHLLKDVVQITAKKLDVKACSIRLVDEETGEMVLKAVYGLSSAYLKTGPVVSGDSEFLKSIDTGQAQQIVDISKDRRIHYSKEAIGEGICSQLSVGLIKDESTIGILSVFTEASHHFSEEEVRVFETIANQVTAAVYLTQLHARYVDHQRVKQELVLAAKIQDNLLSPPDAADTDLDIYAHCLPCEEIGGDFYEFTRLTDSKLGIGIGDVSGKGIPAALLMSSVCMLLRSQTKDIRSVYELLSYLNQALCEQVLPEQFTTLFYGVIDHDEQSLRYVNAGHNFPLLIRQGQIMTLETGGPPAGLLSYASYREGRTEIFPGDILVLYTDGFVDAVDQNDDAFGDDRFREAVLKYHLLSAREMVNKIEAEVVQFEDDTRRRQDDRTLVIVKF